MTTTKYTPAPIKWPGGKYRELKHLIPVIPKNIETFVDPFLGGASLPINIEAKHIIVNDIDKDLIDFYSLTKKDQKRFMVLLEGVSKARDVARSYHITPDNFQETFRMACVNSLRNVAPELRCTDFVSKIITAEMMRRHSKITALLEAGKSPEPTYAATGVFAVIYYVVRHAFNQNSAKNLSSDPVVRTAMWYIIRELAHGGMMRFSKNGDFNIPYGGLSYNSKRLMNKSHLIQGVWDFFSKHKTQFENEDFMDVLHKARLGPNDFVFLDPPYDTAFSSYSTGSSFSRYPDIFDWMCDTPAKFLMVTKETDFINELLAQARLRHNRLFTRTFLKQYQVNIKNRNQRSATHLLIANYDMDALS